MTSRRTEYFGHPPQQNLQRRADMIWTLLGDDPRYSSHGRAVGAADVTPETVDRQIALARLQGVSGADGVPADLAAARRAALERSGLKVDAFVKWRGGADALAAADDIARRRALADDLDIVAVDSRTSAEDMAKLDALTQSCDVLLPMGSFMRGERRPAICLFARDRSGRIVGATAAVAQYHPDHPNAGHVWWGMLATDSARRGEGIALIMGAHSMRAMRDRFGYRDVFTGIREGNAPSERLCEKLGLRRTDEVDLIAIDPDAFAGERLTK